MRVVERLLALVLVLALALGTAGCTGRPGSGTAHQMAISTWMAELPGRSEPIQLTLPVHLDTLLPRAPVDYVLRARVDVAPEMRGRPLTLAVAHMPALATLRVDGSEAVPVDASTLDRYRASAPHRWRIPEDASKDGHLDLELHVRHRFVRSAWVDSTPVLTTDPLGGQALAAVYEFNTVAAIGALAAALVVAFLYGVIWASLRDRRRAVYGWFAVGAMCGMPYPAFLLGISQPVLGVYEAPFMIVALALGSIVAMFFTRAYVGAPPPSQLWFAVFAAVVAIALLARSPFISILVMGPVVVVVTVVNAIAQIAFLVRLRREKMPSGTSVYALAMAWPASVLLGLPDILAWLGYGEPTSGIRTASLGIMGISLYQAAALTREHVVSRRRSDELNVELGERVKLLQAKHREVELLNDELRRQIAARSRELAEKLARMEEEEIAPPPVLGAGAVVEGRYRVIKELGSGGMGTVYEVERISDAKHFALKALVAGGGSEARARFAREAQIVANVNHPNVVSIVDVDVAKSGFIFLVMELVASGTTLHNVRRRERDIPWSLGVLAQVAAGIDAVHGAGIIHRDLKPGNILFSRGLDGRRPLVKITDFGISSLVPDGTRISAMERIAMMAQASPSDPDLLDPYSSRGEGMAPVRISELEAGRAGAPAGDSGADSDLVTSAAPAMLDLEYRPDDTDTALQVKTEQLTKHEGAVERGRGSDRPAAGSDRPPAGSDRPPPPSASKPGAGKRTPTAPLTETGLIFGTPQYMAQELTSGTKNATRASDVFSLGIIAFEVLTGRRPFPEAPVTSKLNGRPLPHAVPFRTACPTLPPEIAALLDRAMAHDARVRPTAKELAMALKEAADRLNPS
jgi:serine/threonine protein kinase